MGWVVTRTTRRLQNVWGKRCSGSLFSGAWWQTPAGRRSSAAQLNNQRWNTTRRWMYPQIPPSKQAGAHLSSRFLWLANPNNYFWWVLPFFLSAHRKGFVYSASCTAKVMFSKQSLSKTLLLLVKNWAVLNHMLAQILLQTPLDQTVEAHWNPCHKSGEGTKRLPPLQKSAIWSF